MRASDARRGGRHEARERGAYECESEHRTDEPDAPIRPATAPLVEFLAVEQVEAVIELYRGLRRAECSAPKST